MNIILITLGCDKNTADSERMLGLIDKSEYCLVSDPEEADVAVVNTCCFIDAAKEESIEAILDMARMKSEGKCRKLIVAGCLSERYKDEIITELPEVDAYIGVKELDRRIKAECGSYDLRTFYMMVSDIIRAIIEAERKPEK